MCVCVCVCEREREYARFTLQLHACVCVCACTYMHVCACVCMCIYVCGTLILSILENSIVPLEDIVVVSKHQESQLHLQLSAPAIMRPPNALGILYSYACTCARLMVYMQSKVSTRQKHYNGLIYTSPVMPLCIHAL